MEINALHALSLRTGLFLFKAFRRKGQDMKDINVKEVSANGMEKLIIELPPEKEVSDDGICPVVRALAERAASNFLLYCDFVEDGGLRALLAMDKMFCFGDSDNAVELLKVAFEAVDLNECSDELSLLDECEKVHEFSYVDFMYVFINTECIQKLLSVFNITVSIRDLS